jgi:anti-anti-sigma factor
LGWRQAFAPSSAALRTVRNAHTGGRDVFPTLSTDDRPSPGTVQGMREGPAWVIAVRGEHDVSTVPDVVRELDHAFAAGGPVVVDLTEVDFMDSAILNTLLTARERALGRQEGSFAVVAPLDSFPSRVLALVAGTLVPTYPNRIAAVAAITPATS